MTELSRTILPRRVPELAWDCIPPAMFALFLSLLHFPECWRGEIPIGGDRSAFQIGLMAHFHMCLEQGRLPFWNEWWGFGFPGLAESQVGALYPPHLVAYSVGDTLSAFRWTFLAHRFAMIAIAYLAFRCLGLRRMGASLATLTFTLSGFTLCHLEQQWAVEGLVWFPLILALSDQAVLRGKAWACLALPPVLALFLLIGHFQLAFISLVTAMLWVTAGWLFDRRSRSEVGAIRFVGRVLGWLGTVAIGFALAGPQILPTAFFAAEIRERNPALSQLDYLTTHAFPPFAHAGWILPGFQCHDPLWRAVVWTPWRAAPEECLAYIGIVPLLLAVSTLRYLRQRGRIASAWLLLAITAALASLPYFPGHESILALPGFGYFRASCRWMMAVTFFLSLLAGWRLDRIRIARLRYRTILGWSAATLLVATAIPLTWTALVWQASRPDSTFGDPSPFAVLAQQPQGVDATTLRAWVRSGRPLTERISLGKDWSAVLYRELAPATAMAAAILAVLLLIRWITPSTWVLTVILVTAADLTSLHCRFAPVSTSRAMLEPSGAFADSLRELPTGSRVLTSVQNLPMVWGLAPVLAYRTLDLPPAFDPLTGNPWPATDWSEAATTPWPNAGIAAALLASRPGRDGGMGYSALSTWFPEWRFFGMENEWRIFDADGIRAWIVPNSQPPQPFESLWDPKRETWTLRGELPIESRPARLLLAQPALRGWSAEQVDSGQRVQLPDHASPEGFAWQTWNLDGSGPVHVEVRYTPPGWRAGLLLAGLGLAAWLGWIGWAVRQGSVGRLSRAGQP